VKHRGKPLYELARAGVTIDRDERPVEIAAFELRPVELEPATVAFAVTCSKGTYVRVLAEDVGRALGTLATLASLRRTAFGDFTVAEAHPLDEILARPAGDLPLIAPQDALRSARRVPVDRAQAFAIASGQRAGLAAIEPPRAAERLAAVLAPDGCLLAVLAAEEGAWVLKRVVMPEASQLYRP
jgi:tRNA pseudouridine55 synthase